MIHPWHMWGNSATLQLRPGITLAQTGQLARIEYKRPETWRFMFYANLLRTNLSVAGANVVVGFNVFTGVGRANLQVNHNPFETYLFQVALTGEQGGYPVKFSTEVLGPHRVDGNNDSGSICDVIVGQDIQVGYFVFLSDPGGALPTDDAQLEVGCLLAPVHHIRPDWFAAGTLTERFAGEETKGR